MRLCLACREAFEGNSWTCPACGCLPESKQGFQSFATPEDGDGFHPEYFAALAAIEEKNFWFRARNRLIADCLERFFVQPGCFLEVGCGTGYVLNAISQRFPETALVGSEYFVEGLSFAQSRVPQATLIQADARKIPFVEEFDVVGVFDVLEHIEDDTMALSSLYRAIRPKGGVILTVPQHQWLWSSTDELACHQRRYSRGELDRKLQAAGFTVEYATSFVTFLMPALLASRMYKRAPGVDPLAELKMNPVLNACFGAIMSFEQLIIKIGCRFPFGGSLLMVGRK